jgi:uncharacterized protein YbjQ (UPF0145 family)
MILTTTNLIEGKKIVEYKGIVTAEAIAGANVVKDIFASFTDFFGGRSKTYEDELKKTREAALKELEEAALAMGANAVVGVDLDYETIGRGGSMLMVNASGTAVIVE